jgi:hypothetical protein
MDFTDLFVLSNVEIVPKVRVVTRKTAHVQDSVTLDGKVHCVIKVHILNSYSNTKPNKKADITS